MFHSYFKIAFRSLLKFKGYTAINLVGLSLGLMAGTVILLFVLDELSFDQFHSKKERLYRVNTVFTKPGSDKEGINETNGWPVGKILENNYPEIEAVLYTRSASFLLVNYEGKRIRQKNHFASPEFFQLFSFPLIKGNPATSLVNPLSVVISEDMEKKFFPEGDALNKTLVMGDSLNFIVTGVMANIPANSHIQADMITSFSTFQTLNPDFSFDQGWGSINMRNYVLLKEGADIQNLSTKAQNIYAEGASAMLNDWGVSAAIYFEPFTSIYLNSKTGNGMGPKGSMERLYLMSCIAFFVILLACINFINLTTARSVYRAKEVVLRKVVGSSRQSLIRQFLSESLALTILALFVALAFLGVLLPFFNQLLNKHYELFNLLQPEIIGGIGLLVMIITLLSGYYPALIISSMKPVEVLKGKLLNSQQGIRLRRGLVIFQFMISTGLITGTWVVLNQLDYMQKQNLGFQKEEILVLNAARVNSSNPQAFETFKDQLKSLSLVQEVSYSNALPGTPGWVGQIAYPEGKSGAHARSVEYMAIDEHYTEVLKIEFVAGHGFTKNHEGELNNGLIINETAVTQFGWSSPQDAIGKKITSPSGHPEGEIIGVVKDFHQAGLQQKIGPIAMDYAPSKSYLYAIRYRAAETQQLISAVEELWKKSFPGNDFNYYFLDESFANQYQAERRLAEVFALFAGITIIIAMIGLLGLVSFIVVTKTKEIGVRKILGASIFDISRLLSAEFIWLVLIANLIAVPIIWYLANEWLQKFAYRITLSPVLFIGTAILAIGITLITISFQSIRAAMANPVDSIRND